MAKTEEQLSNFSPSSFPRDKFYRLEEKCQNRALRGTQHLCHDVFIIYNMKNQAGSWGQNAKINQSLQTRSFDICGDTSQGMHILGSCIILAWMLTADKKEFQKFHFCQLYCLTELVLVRIDFKIPILFVYTEYHI